MLLSLGYIERNKSNFYYICKSFGSIYIVIKRLVLLNCFLKIPYNCEVQVNPAQKWNVFIIHKVIQGFGAYSDVYLSQG